MATPNLRPADIELLVSLVKHAKYTLNFTEVAEKFGITVNAAGQRWNRLKTKILAHQKLELKGGDEMILLINLAKQLGAADVNFGAVADEIGCANGGAAAQRWNRLRLKILGGKNALAGSTLITPNRPAKAPKVAPAKAKVTKSSAKGKGKKLTKAAEQALAEAFSDDHEDSDYGDDADATFTVQKPGKKRKMVVDHDSKAEEEDGDEFEPARDVPMRSVNDTFIPKYYPEKYTAAKDYDDEY